VTASRPVNLCLLMCGLFGGGSNQMICDSNHGKSCSLGGTGEIGCGVSTWEFDPRYQRSLTLLCQWIAGVPAILFRN